MDAEQLPEKHAPSARHKYPQGRIPFRLLVINCKGFHSSHCSGVMVINLSLSMGNPAILESKMRLQNTACETILDSCESKTSKRSSPNQRLTCYLSNKVFLPATKQGHEVLTHPISNDHQWNTCSRLCSCITCGFTSRRVAPRLILSATRPREHVLGGQCNLL